MCCYKLLLEELSDVSLRDQLEACICIYRLIHYIYNNSNDGPNVLTILALAYTTMNNVGGSPYNHVTVWELHSLMLPSIKIQNGNSSSECWWHATFY
jgi:hypothetical protein